jgi:hypothetical protein
VRSNKNTSRFREALYVLRVPFYSVTLVHAPIPHGKPRGSGNHGHGEMSRIHVERYSMRVRGMSQEGVYNHGFI